MNLTFAGGAGTVTGSKTWVRSGSTQLLVDCGLFQGLKHLRLRNWEPLPFDAADLDAVLLTHAHIDHSGYLPRLVAQGFRGPIFCTEATADMVRLLLPDSGHIQEEDARYARRRRSSKHRPPKPLYTESQAVTALGYLEPVGWNQPVEIGPLRATFSPAGHILGASMIRVEDRGSSVLFSGDLGRPVDPVMPPPAEVLEPVDWLVLESTYGLRTHPEEDPLQALHDVVHRTISRGGTVIIPAFAVGRTQAVLWGLHQLVESGRLPSDLRVFVNSPMAVDATELYLRHADEHRLGREEAQRMCATARLIRTVEESKDLNEDRGPKVIVSASGMLTGGRVLHHLASFAPDPRNTLLLCGFQATGTRGAAILDGASHVRAYGRDVPIRCEVQRVDTWSAHADHTEILQWLRGFAAPPRHTYLVHGEPNASDAMRGHIQQKLGWSVSVAELDAEVTLRPSRYRRRSATPKTMDEVHVDDDLWDRVHLPSALTVVGTVDRNGSPNLATKHMAMPVSWGPWFGFVCDPSHQTWQNATATGSFTVSYLAPEQALTATMASAPRNQQDDKPTLATIETRPASKLDGVYVDGCRMALECVLERVVDGLGGNGLLIGKVVAAHVDAEALRSAETDDAESIYTSPLLVYVHPHRFGVLQHTDALPLHAGFRR